MRRLEVHWFDTRGFVLVIRRSSEPAGPDSGPIFLDDRPANVPFVHPDEGRGAREAAAVAPALLVRGVSKHRGKIRVVVADATVIEARAHGLALKVELKLGDCGIANVRGS